MILLHSVKCRDYQCLISYLRQEAVLDIAKSIIVSLGLMKLPTFTMSLLHKILPLEHRTNPTMFLAISTRRGSTSSFLKTSSYDPDTQAAQRHVDRRCSFLLQSWQRRGGTASRAAISSLWLKTDGRRECGKNPSPRDQVALWRKPEPDGREGERYRTLESRSLWEVQAKITPFSVTWNPKGSRSCMALQDSRTHGAHHSFSFSFPMSNTGLRPHPSYNALKKSRPRRKTDGLLRAITI